jgi:DNA replication protein DnaC
LKKISSEISREIKTRPAICETHGEFVSKNWIADVWSRCPACETERLEKQKADEEEAARVARRQRWIDRLNAAGIPDRFKERTLDTFIAETEGQKQALEFAHEYAANFSDVLATGRSAIFVGKPGTGKTHLACAIALRIIGTENRKVLFLTTQRLVRRIRDTWAHGNPETETQAIEKLVYPDLLILDEVGVQSGSDNERNILFDVINERYEKSKPTLMLSNLPIKEMTEYLSERIIDRLRENGGKRMVFDWESHRKNKGDQQ